MNVSCCFNRGSGKIVSEASSSVIILLSVTFFNNLRLQTSAHAVTCSKLCGSIHSHFNNSLRWKILEHTSLAGRSFWHGSTARSACSTLRSSRCDVRHRCRCHWIPCRGYSANNTLFTQTHNGAVACQIMDALHHGVVPMGKVTHPRNLCCRTRQF